MISIEDFKDAERVFYYFEEISKIPHGSENTAKIAEYLVDFAKAKNLWYVRDEANNVIIRKPATKGYEDKPTVIFQGHTDMVALKEPGCPIDMENEGIELEDGGARLIAKTAQGGMRDALSLLELCAGMKEKIDEALATQILGVGNRGSVEAVVNAIAAKDYGKIYSCISDIVMSAKDIAVFWRELIEYYRDIMVAKTIGLAAKDYLDLTDNETDTLIGISKVFSLEQLLYHSRLLEDALYNMSKAGVPKRSIAELTLTRMCEPRLSLTQESLLARIYELENTVTMLKHGISVPSHSTVAEPIDRNEQNVPKSQENSQAETKNKPATSTNQTRGSKDFRMLGCWSEVLETLNKTKSSLAGLLDSSVCYVNDGTYLIKVKNKFISKMISGDENISAIKAAVISVGDFSVPPASVVVESEEENSMNANLLMEELEEDYNNF